MAMFLTFVLSMMVTLVLIPPFMRSAAHLNIVDSPDDERKIHTGNVPRIGGLAMIVGVLIPVIMLLSGQEDITYLYIGLLTLLIFGVLDDRFQLNYKLKFIGQLIAIISVVLMGSVVIYKMPIFTDSIMPSYFAIPFTIFAMLGVTNATNLSDGLDGLAGGMSLLSLAGIALIAYTLENTVVLLLCIAVLGSILGFLRFNTFPARVFMGDAGSQFLGFTLGVSVILLTQDDKAIISPSIPLFLLGVPILDTITVMIKRIRSGCSPFRPDKNHIHHRLLAIGFPHHQAVLIIYVVQALMVISGYLLRYQDDVSVLIYYVIACALILGALHLAQKNGWRVHSENKKNSFVLLGNKFRWLEEQKNLLNILVITTGLLLFAFFLTSSVYVENLPKDYYLVIVFLISLFTALFFVRNRQRIGWLEKAVIYTLGALIIFVIKDHTELQTGLIKYQDMIFALLAVFVIMGFRYTKVKSYEPTPLDFLVVLAAIISAVLPDIDSVNKEIGLNVTRLIILFYATEFVLIHIHKRLDLVRYTVFSILGILSINGIS